MLKFIPPDCLTRVADRLPFLVDNPIYRNVNLRVAFFTLGAIVAVVKAYKITRKFLWPLFWFDRNLASRYGENTWAVITGASDGIGEAFALELARRGFHIVLVGRNEEKLGKVAQELIKTYPGTQTRIVVADFAKSHEAGFAEHIHNQVRGLDVSILVNNAGVFETGFFYEMPLTRVSGMILTNLISHALITRAFLPDLAARTERSAIINVSSTAGASARPFVALYSGTKVFHDYLSRGLVYEHPNIDIISMKPGPVSTKMTGYRDINYKTISREDFVRSTLLALGRIPHTYGHWKHRLDGFFVSLCPDFLKVWYFRKRYL